MENKNIVDGKYIAYKGFDKNMTCRGHKFDFNEVYSKPYKENPRTCTDDGFHYCDKLEDVFHHYPIANDNIFCEIEILGPHKREKDKCVTTSLRVIKKIDMSDILNIKYEKNINLPLLKTIQENYPQVIIAGSSALFLHGIKLERIQQTKSSDIDLIVPYFTLFESKILGKKDDLLDNLLSSIKHVGSKDSNTSGGNTNKKNQNDFDETFDFDGVKADVKIDPKAKYELIEYKGFNYKVGLLEDTMEAKFRYAMQGNQKHKSDVYEICGKTGR